MSWKQISKSLEQVTQLEDYPYQHQLTPTYPTFSITCFYLMRDYDEDIKGDQVEC